MLIFLLYMLFSRHPAHSERPLVSTLPPSPRPAQAAEDGWTCTTYPK